MVLRRSRDVFTANNTNTSFLYCSYVPGKIPRDSTHPANVEHFLVHVNMIGLQ